MIKERTKKKIFITTPIFYPNAKPHIGHAYTSVVCDFLARYYKTIGYDAKFSTGLDEHGQKIEKTAKQKGLSPQEHVDNMQEFFRDLMQIYSIDYDVFIRTTSYEHKKAVHHFWRTLDNNGFIYLDKYSGWYNVSDEAFVKLDEVDKKTISKDKKAACTKDGKAIIFIEEECYFFKLSAFTTPLLDHYTKNPEEIFPKTRRNEVLGFLKQKLNDIAISRTTISWGFEVPSERTTNTIQQCIQYIMHLIKNTTQKKHIIYVWIDALVNYITALDYPNHFADNKDYWKNSVHVVGKDILKFHAIYWPAFLKAAKIPLPKKILAHGWWLIDQEKMSKSLGNIVDPMVLAQEYGTDQVRWFFMREMVFGDDSNFASEQLQVRLNELSNVIGNLAQRSMSLLEKQHKGKICPQEDVLDSKKFFKQLDQTIEDNKLSHYAQEIYNFASRANQYFDNAEPWKNKDKSQQILSNTIFILKILGQAMYPIMPGKTSILLKALGMDMKLEERNHAFLDPKTTIQTPEILFTRQVVEK